jgi:hypothetical protein
MTTSAELRVLSQAALTGQTSAGANVYTALDRPTWAGNCPVIFLQTPSEDKESLGRNGAPQYVVTTTVRVVARVQQPQEANDAGAAKAELALEQLQAQIEVALINNPALMSKLQQFAWVRVQKQVSGESAVHLGELVMEIGMEFYQGPEDFYPIVGAPIEQITIDADLVNVADPTGTYANPPFPDAVVPAPRTSGPDGRAEGGLDFTFPPQE